MVGTVTSSVAVDVAPACVTLMICVMPLPLTVTVPVREEDEVLAVVVTVILLPLEPEVTETVSHDAELLIIQLVLEVMVNDFCSPDDAKLIEDSDKVSAGVPCMTTSCLLHPIQIRQEIIHISKPFVKLENCVRLNVTFFIRKLLNLNLI